MSAERLWHDRNRDFPPDFFVVDPATCGCTDCIVGESTPLDRLSVRDLLHAVRKGMTIVDRS